MCIDEGKDVACEEKDEYLNTEEAARIRKELNHLVYITREVLIRFYFGNQSVSEIAGGVSKRTC